MTQHQTSSKRRAHSPAHKDARADPAFDPEIINRAAAWTETDGDLQAVAPDVARPIRQSRFMTATIDAPRAALWRDPDDIDVIADINYAARRDDDVRGHLLDIYLPHDAIVRAGHTTPVYIDIHGGGFCYGYKELNRNFNTHLAHEGFGVISLNYRPAPQTDLRGQLADIQQALGWIREHISEYPLNPNAIFITGDSAGAALALLTLAIENDPAAAHAFGIGAASGLPIAGGALISGVYTLARPHAGNSHRRTIRAMLEQTLGASFFAGLDEAAPYLTPESVVRSVNLPALLLNTSSDDFVQTETLALATALAHADADFEIHDWKTGRLQTLGHVFPVCMTWLEESQRVLQQMKAFAYARV